MRLKYRPMPLLHPRSRWTAGLAIAIPLLACNRASSLTYGDAAPEAGASVAGSAYATPSATASAIPSASTSTPTLVATPPSLARWSTLPSDAAWKGHFVVRMDAGIPGTGWWAWSSADGKVVNGVEPFGAHVLELTFARPCQAKLREKDGMGYGIPFTVVDGKLWVDGRGAGWIQGDDALLCPGDMDEFYLLEHGVCTRWKRSWRDFSVSATPATCELEQRDGERVLMLGKDPGRRWHIRGSALVHEATIAHPEETMRVVASFAKAKALRAKLDPPSKP